MKVLLLNGATQRMDGLVQITWWSAERNNYIENLLLVYTFLLITLCEGGKITINTENVVCWDSSNCSQVNAFFDSWLGRKFFLSSYVLRAGAFFSVWNWKALLSIFHFLFTNFGRRPFSEKTIQASLCLICIINRLQGVNEPLAKDTFFRLRPDLPIHFKTLVTWVLWNVRFPFCSIML